LHLRGKKEKDTGENCIMKSFIICTFAKCYKNDQIKECDMGMACGTHKRKIHTYFFGGKNLEERLERPSPSYDDNIKWRLKK
jgi:hypothetical protein